MRPRLNLTNQRFGRLVAIEPAGSNSQGNAMWRCLCDCGNEIVVNSQRLKSGHTKSCGCLGHDIIVQRNKAGRINPDIARQDYRLYRIYYGMITRCYNPNDKGFAHYGALNVTVCKEWLDSFDAFEKWALTHGYKDVLSIDRINPFGNYEPDNCRWATAKEQANNRRSNYLKNKEA